MEPFAFAYTRVLARLVMPKVVVVALVARSVLAKKLVEVALVVVPKNPRKLVVEALNAWKAVAKSEVEVAFVVVALSPVKFCKVVEAYEMIPPQNCDAMEVEVATT